MRSANLIHMIYGIVVLILASSHSARAALNDGKSTLLLYSTDLSSDNLISIQLDSITLNQIIADSEKQGRIVKKINFRDLTRLNELLDGKSTKFTFTDDAANSVCDISCNANCKVAATSTARVSTTTSTTTRRATAPPPRPFVTKKDATTGPPYLPPVSVTQKDEGITPPTRLTTTTTTSKPVTTSKVISTTTRAPATTSRLISSSAATTTTQRSIASTTTTVRDTEKPTTSRTRATTTQAAPRTTTTTTRRPAPATTTLTTVRRSSKSTPGPSYLPLARKSTTRAVTVSSRITYPPATWPSFSTSYTQTYPTWTGPIRRFTYEPKSTTTTARYEYKEPSNSLTFDTE